MDVEAFLKSLGLEQYARVFAENDIDAQVLIRITANDLIELGIKSIGHRRKILAAVAETPNFAAVAPEDKSRGKSPHFIEKRSEVAEAERRHLTIMFVDLVGSTEMASSLDPEDMREIIGSYQNAVAGEISRFEGHVAKYMGDGVLCYFGWPRSHEDDAERAIRAGLSIAKSVANLITPARASLAARLGIATGLCVVGDIIGTGSAQEEAVVGETPNLAARLQALARPGEVVVSDGTRRLLGDVFDVDDLGPHDLKGIPGPTRLFAIVAERPAETRYAARASGPRQTMVGRETELGLSLDRWAQAKAGEGQLVLLSGEAGIGKSRIARAVIDAVDAEPHTGMSYQCSPYHSNSPFYPAVQQLSASIGIAEIESNEAKLGKLRTAEGVSALSLPHLAALLGIEGGDRTGADSLTPQQLRARTLQALIDRLIALSRVRPVLFIVEDIHWIDASTLELLDQCVDHIQSARVLILATTRPTFEHGFGGHPIVTKLTLNRLGREQIEAMVNRIARETKLPQTVFDKIVAATDGVPLFVEELTKSVVESIRFESADEMQIGEHLEIPLTLHGSLMARLDRLHPVKEVAQTAACIGREFTHGLLQSIMPLDPTAFREALDKLVRAELVFRRGVGSEARYIFKHALVRDAAYFSMLKSVRRSIHGRLADNLIRDSDVEPELVGHHLAAAGRDSEAIGFFRRAGLAAASRYANVEAVSHYGYSLECLNSLPSNERWTDLELDIRLEMGIPLIASSGYASDRVERHFLRAEALCEQSKRGSDLFFVRKALWNYYLDRPELGKSLASARQLQTEAFGRNDPELRTVAHRARATSHFYLGEFESASDQAEAGMSAWLKVGGDFDVGKYGEDSLSISQTYLGLAQIFLGLVDTGLANCERSARTAARLDHPLNLAFCLMNLAVARRFRYEPADCRDVAEKMLVVADDRKLAFWAGGARAMLGWVIGVSDSPSKGLALLHEGIDRWQSTGAALHLPHFYSSVADVCLRCGKTDEGLAAIEKAKDFIDGTGELWTSAEVERVHGLLLSQCSDERAIEVLLNAERIASKQRARWLSIHTLVDLSNLKLDSDVQKAVDSSLHRQLADQSEGRDMQIIREAILHVSGL